ncbi:MAG: response regulator [Vicinamibacteria bacterium]|nr:response regulator [Vicinamibacteria bacterium]
MTEKETNAVPKAESQAGSRPDDGEKPRLERAAFLAHMRHELRTPVNAILGYSEMLIEDARASGCETVDDLERIHRAGESLLKLINELLDPEQLEREGVDIEAMGARARHDLLTPVNAVIGYSEMLIEDVAGSNAAAMTADLERIRSAGAKLLMLIDDIVRFSAMETRTNDFPKADTAVAGMIEDVVSALHPTSSGENAVQAAASGSILVVDDNEINRDMLARRLMREGYQTATASNGRQALEMVARGGLDLVLLDVIMPEMNGYEVLRRLKADEALRHVPVIMISALDELDSVVRCIEGGAEDYLPKPFNPVLLRARIGACIEKKRLRDREVLHLRMIEEQRRRADELLHVILPHEIVEELKATNAVKPKRYENVAVLFCDVVGFTPFCASREPDEVVRHLQQLVEAFEEISIQHEMQKIKTIGDAFMATAGAIRPVARPALNAVRCGLDMVASARSLPAGWDVRVGIHVGPVTAGVVGHRQYLFDLWGDTVNTAARVESHGHNGFVNVSATTWSQVADVCEGASLGQIRLKGIGMMEIHEIHGLRQSTSPPTNGNASTDRSRERRLP